VESILTQNKTSIDKFLFSGGLGLHALAIIAVVLMVTAQADSFVGWSSNDITSMMFAIFFCIAVMFLYGSYFIKLSLPISGSVTK